MDENAMRIAQTFPHYKRKYRCCCGCMHIKTFFNMVVGLSMLVLLYHTICFLLVMASPSVAMAIGIWTSLLLFALLAVNWCLLIITFIGLDRYKKDYFLPFYILSIVRLVVAAILVVFFIWMLVDTGLRSRIAYLITGLIVPDSKSEYFATSVLLMSVIVLVIDLPLVNCARRCYNYLEDVEEYIANYGKPTCVENPTFILDIPI